MEDEYPQIEETEQCYQEEEMQKLREDYITDFTSVEEITFKTAHLFAEYIITKDIKLALAIYNELKSQLFIKDINE